MEGGGVGEEFEEKFGEGEFEEGEEFAGEIELGVTGERGGGR